MNAKDAIKGTMDLAEMVLKTYVGDLSDTELMTRPVKGNNHLAWQLGHLISSENSLLNGVCPGAGAELPAGFKEQHEKGTVGSDDASKFLANVVLPTPSITKSTPVPPVSFFVSSAKFCFV